MLAFIELASLVGHAGIVIPRVASGALACATCAEIAWPGLRIEVVLFAGVLLVAMLAMMDGPGSAMIPRFGASLAPALYLGLPLGMLVAAHRWLGRDAVLLLVATIVVSDSLQYYSGRMFGRHLLAPSISPKKTIEGAVGGVIGGILTAVIAGRWWMEPVPPQTLAVVGGLVVAAGILGDLFESLLKRSAGVKDSSGLIPGHGGVLDRIDALLFAAPVYYVALSFLS